jgi:hypothetical protein
MSSDDKNASVISPTRLHMRVCVCVCVCACVACVYVSLCICMYVSVYALVSPCYVYNTMWCVVCCDATISNAEECINILVRIAAMLVGATCTRPKCRIYVCKVPNIGEI